MSIDDLITHVKGGIAIPCFDATFASDDVEGGESKNASPEAHDVT